MAEELIIQYSVENNPSYTTNLALFTNVKNSIDLRKLIIQGKIEAALLNASMIIDPFHVAIAGHKALQLFQQGKMKTRTLHSEIVFNLSPSTNEYKGSSKGFGCDIIEAKINMWCVNLTESVKQNQDPSFLLQRVGTNELFENPDVLGNSARISKMINESFKKFGILDNTSSVLVVIMTQENAEEKVSASFILGI
ncbi:EKC/KEOPS complex subunit Tprkb-like [Stylophora pistillata]|uniref:EKC/KEOPS complex subunit Tprkb-like n=1 Tax=Stylophora pistillata TaxID=50429 RepID=UPI000C0435AE|nr:EKC/KEOPS complex subunit Tprkb-like [Stylophora pistillata]